MSLKGVAIFHTFVNLITCWSWGVLDLHASCRIRRGSCRIGGWFTTGQFISACAPHVQSGVFRATLAGSPDSVELWSIFHMNPDRYICSLRFSNLKAKSHAIHLRAELKFKYYAILQYGRERLVKNSVVYLPMLQPNPDSVHFYWGSRRCRSGSVRIFNSNGAVNLLGLIRQL